MTIQKVVEGAVQAWWSVGVNPLKSAVADIQDLHQQFVNQIIKPRPSAEMRRGEWERAADIFESAGELYRAMFCLHKAIETRQGISSGHYRKISYLYYRVGNLERSKKYLKYARYQQIVENRELAKRYLEGCRLKIELAEVMRDLKDDMQDEPLVFERNLKAYIEFRNAS
ncbi:MAG: hypothetical protein A3I09_03940 [Deltaproteobacteria bacterium RIFCSPLOWO2_02_FULL_47_10]|nr:MAG: hypothetical protein A3I09_03940 [Deltaproteobacteria bacterium RIFCSPLOWO2_02_FULL_47_10]